MRLARRAYEASRSQQLRFQGVFVNGGIDEVRCGQRGASFHTMRTHAGGAGGPARGAAPRRLLLRAAAGGR